MEEVWKELERKGELSHCKKCHKKIWLYWFTDKLYSKDEMHICAPCMFNRK